MKGPIFTLCAFILMFAVVAAAAASKTGDPRICTNAPPTHHAYFCAQAAATNAVRTRMAARQHVTRWYYPVYCDMNRSLLRWKCDLLNGGPYGTAWVTFKNTSRGWTTAVTIRLLAG